MSKRRGQMLGAALLAIPVAIAGCGSSDFQNKPRIPAPLEVNAAIGDKRITIAPNHFGAGLVNLTISNQSDRVVSLTVKGGDIDTASGPIDPNSVGNFKLNFAQGSYDVSAGQSSTAVLNVGPERASAQNQLLLP